VIAGGVAYRGKQLLFAWEAAVDRANANTGAAGHFFHGNLGTTLGEERLRGIEHALKVALGIFAFAPRRAASFIHGS
jgi:hypothetical protein